MNYPEQIPENRGKKIWKFEDCFKSDNKFKLVRCYTHNVPRIIGMHSHRFYEINIILAGEGRHYIEERLTIKSQALKIKNVLKIRRP